MKMRRSLLNKSIISLYNKSGVSLSIDYLPTFNVNPLSSINLNLAQSIVKRNGSNISETQIKTIHDFRRNLVIGGI
jgi:hypothetical protein